MELEIVNKLFLELSQVATAETEKEIALKRGLELIVHVGIVDGDTPELKVASMQNIAKDTLRRIRLY